MRRRVLRARNSCKINERVEYRDVISSSSSSSRYLTDDQTSRKRYGPVIYFQNVTPANYRPPWFSCRDAVYDSGSAFRRGEKERRVFRQREVAGPFPRSDKFTVYLNRSRAYARPAQENLRSRSPDGHVNNLSVRFHRPRRPVAPRRVWKIWSRRVSRSTCFSECACTCTPVHTSARYTVKRETVAY